MTQIAITSGSKSPLDRALLPLSRDINWRKLWDVAREHGVQDAQSISAVLCAITMPVFSKDFSVASPTMKALLLLLMFQNSILTVTSITCWTCSEIPAMTPSSLQHPFFTASVDKTLLFLFNAFTYPVW